MTDFCGSRLFAGIVVVNPTLLQAVTGSKSAKLWTFAIPFPSCPLPGLLARGKTPCPKEWDRVLFPHTLVGAQDRVFGVCGIYGGESIAFVCHQPIRQGENFLLLPLLWLFRRFFRAVRVRQIMISGLHLSSPRCRWVGPGRAQSCVSVQLSFWIVGVCPVV